MLIKSLRMKNFRQFKGTTEINFSCDEEKNVTVILGNNTFGKTTLLQAFNWCLYGTVNFARNDKFLLNYELSTQMRNGDNEIVEVEINLLHGDKEYTITRTQRYNCSGNKPIGESVSAISLISKKKDGQTEFEPPVKIKKIINDILPEGLSTYFFFDTERISTVSDRKDLKKAIKDFTGLSAIENASRHLGDRSKKTTVIGKIYAGMDFNGDAQAQDALNRIQTAKEKRDAIAEQLEECKNQIDHYADRKAELEQKLRDNQATAEYQKHMDDLERKIKEEEKEYAKLIEDYFKEFNSSALSFFIRPLLNVAEGFLKEVKIDDKGVRDITKDSILELIKRGRCLCGREICEGNDAYQHLMAEIKYVPPESIGLTVRHYMDKLKSFSYSFERTYDRLKRIRESIEYSKNRIQDWEYERDDCREKIAGKENMVSSENELADIRSRLRDLETKKERLYQNDGEQKREIEHFQKVFDGLTANSAKNREAKIFLAYAEEIQAWLEPTCIKHELKLRESLEAEVNKIFDEMYHGHRRVAIDEQYHVELIATIADTEIISGESEGANRVKNFAFIAGLVTLAKRQILQDIGISSESYPLVMDAPFSNADEKHTAGISKVLPRIAEQIIMFVMQKDWNYAEPVMNQRVGKKYLLNKFSETFTKIEEA